MHILVNGTEVTAWGEEPPDGDGVPFEVEGVPEVPDGSALHWDGVSFWTVERPVDPAEPIRAIFAAMPALTVGLADKAALRLAGYLPDWDPSATYTLGCLAIKDGKVQRRTVGGVWREVA